jgi:hypothetical protein
LYGDRSFPIGSGAARSTGTTDIFGVFLSNGWHAFLATLLGLIALYFTIKPARAREVALAIGASHVAIVIGLIIWEPSTFWLASNTADQFVHASTAIGGLACGLATRPDRTTARA